jgi:acetoin utilization deacetylase AcuC-like enzyme
VTEVVGHPALARLHPTGSHPECPERVARLLATFPLEAVAAPATREAIEAVHDPGYVELLASLETERWLDGDTLAGPTSFEAASLAAGGAITAAERGGFALVRPPGHHALGGQGMGFCLIGNVAVAARFAQRELGLERVAIVDWDVHHGNGTEAIFRGDDSVLFVSLHQFPFYPGSGGPGTSDETIVNVPLPAGCGDREYLDAFRDCVEPAVTAFDPELLLVSAGFDAHEHDPLAGMLVTDSGFEELARRCTHLAPRVAAVLEGGYNLDTLPRLVDAALTGFTT